MAKRFGAIVLALGFLVACGDEPNGPTIEPRSGGDKKETGGKQSPDPTLTPMKAPDSSELRNKRAEIVAAIDQIEKKYTASFKERFVNHRSVDRIVHDVMSQIRQKVITYEAADAAGLEVYAQSEMRGLTDEVFTDLRSEIEAAIPTRVNPEPAAGDRLEAADKEGMCTNDFEVDFRRLVLSLFKLQPRLALKEEDRLAETEKATFQTDVEAVVGQCLDLSDRYGADAECTLVEGNAREQIKVRNLVETCSTLREQQKIPTLP